jgi:predicted ArsR family transcriptional regulator
MPHAPETRRPATEDEARALASAIRLRILRLCLDHALTNKQVAARLGVNAATTLHHIRKLVATGFLAAEEERRGTRGAREVPYRSTGKSWTLSVGATRVEGGGRAMLDAFLDELSYVDIDPTMGDHTDVERVHLMRLGLRLPPEQLAELSERINTLLDEYASQPPDLENGVPFSVFMALFPDVTRDGIPAPSTRERRTA